METVTTRIPEEDEEALSELEAELTADRSEVLRRLIRQGLSDWRKEKALEKLEAGETTLSGAAAIAEMNVWDFATLAKDRNITWVSGDHLESDLKDL